MSDPLVCPRDQYSLLERDEGFICPHCDHRYPAVAGVVCTLEQPDDFYEGLYVNCVNYLPRSENPLNVWPLWLINSGFMWTVRKYVPEGAAVVELGCACGVRYFGKRYHMTGCDLSFSSLKRLDFYERKIQADAGSYTALPGGSIDAVVSSFFWEHLPPEAKPKLLKECYRILRPDGKLIFLYDVETNNPLIRRYKQKENDLYRKLFLEGDGHLGYQWPAENIRIFESAGFLVLKHKGMEKSWLQSASVFNKVAKFKGGKAFAVFDTALGNPFLFYLYIGLTRIADEFLFRWMPENWARIDMVVAKKAEQPRL